MEKLMTQDKTLKEDADDFVTMIITVISLTSRTYKKEARHSTETPLQKLMLRSSVEISARAPPDFPSLQLSLNYSDCNAITDRAEYV